MTFLFQSLLALGIPLIGLPLLIHLINLRRHRRVEWAAMEFLLESQKRNKKWIVLRQLLLLLMRTAAVALAVFMLAGPVIRSGWAGLFGRGVTHHLILLDDSYSMGDHWEESSALGDAKRAVSQIIDQARGRAANQIVTLLRFSEAKKLAAGASLQFDRQQLDAELIDRLQQFLGALTPSESDAGPVDVLDAASRLTEATPDETRIVYLVSDFREHQWQEHTQLRQLATRLKEDADRLLLVQCVYAERPNLAVTRLEPEFGIRAAGVETSMEISVANYGDVPASAVTVTVEQDGASLPAIVIDEIPPGEEATRRFRVTFATAGAHELTASVESDAIDADNVRYFATDVPAALPVLIVDGSIAGDDGYFMRTALSPGGRNQAGWSPQVEPPSFLRQHERLADFPVICLLDVPRLDEADVTALEEYVRNGGGLAIFLGEQIQQRFYNAQLYREGDGLLPAPLSTPSQLLQEGDSSPDVSVSDHPVFRIFAGQRNNFLAVAQVNFYYAIDEAWSAPDSGDVRTIATLRNGAPLSMEKEFGQGRVVVHLAKLSPKPVELGAWTNWAVNPVFPVFANELVGYLSATQRRFNLQVAGDPVKIELPADEYQAEVLVRAPGETSGQADAVMGSATNGRYEIEAPGAPRSGIWAFEFKTREGRSQSRYVAVNVPTGEGRLKIASQASLAERLRGVTYDYALASELTDASEDLAGFRLSDALLYTLAGVLLVEQLLAVAASYHPAAPGRTA